MLSMRDSPNVEVSSRPSHLLRTGDSIAEICCGFFAVAFQESPNHQFKFPATLMLEREEPGATTRRIRRRAPQSFGGYRVERTSFRAGVAPLKSSAFHGALFQQLHRTLQSGTRRGGVKAMSFHR